jgi:hypothetical protein
LAWEAASDRTSTGDPSCRTRSAVWYKLRALIESDASAGGLPELTIVAVPKAFRADIGLIQQNALDSWLHLPAEVQILVVGSDDGVAEAAAEAGVRHLPTVTASEFGTPLFDDVLRQAEAVAEAPLICFANADVILLGDLVPAVRRVRAHMERFLIVGRCWSLQVTERLDFAAGGAATVHRMIGDAGYLRAKEAADYFIFPKGLYGRVPPFAVGRARIDNWLLWRARELGVAVVDATSAITAVHQEHEYEHVPGGKRWAYAGPEAQRNRHLAGGDRGFYTLRDASHSLTPDGIRRNLSSIARLSTRLLRLRIRISALVRHGG